MYPDPMRYGYENDIVDSFSNEQVVSKQLGHKWDFNQSIQDIKDAAYAAAKKAHEDSRWNGIII